MSVGGRAVALHSIQPEDPISANRDSDLARRDGVTILLSGPHTASEPDPKTRKEVSQGYETKDSY